VKVFAGKGLSQWDTGWDKLTAVSDLATSSPPATCEICLMSHRDTWVRLELTRACVSDEFADVTATAFHGATVRPRNRLPRALRTLAPYLLSGRFPLSAAARANHSRQGNFSSTTATSEATNPRKATSSFRRGNRAQRGRQPVVAFIGYGTTRRYPMTEHVVALTGYVTSTRANATPGSQPWSRR